MSRKVITLFSYFLPNLVHAILCLLSSGKTLQKNQLKLILLKGNALALRQTQFAKKPKNPV